MVLTAPVLESKLSVHAAPCKVQVTTISGDSILLTLNLDSSLAELKAKVEQGLHVPSAEQALLLNGAPLVDGDTPWTAAKPPLELTLRRQPRPAGLSPVMAASCLSSINSRVWGKTALHLALEANSASACMELLESPDFFGINASDPDGVTPLHLAADLGFASACEAIIHHREYSKVLHQDRRGRTPLHCAAASGLGGVVKALLDHQNTAVLNTKDELGKSALHCAIAAGQDHSCVVLLGRPDVDRAAVAEENFGLPSGFPGDQGPEDTAEMPSERRFTALHCAASARMWRSCLEMLKHDEFAPQMNILDEAGRTPLHHAAEKGLSQVCLAMLESPIISNINAMDNQHCTAFELAAKKRLSDVLLAFVMHSGFNVNMQMGIRESTALHIAAENKQIGICGTLLEKEDFTELDATDTQRRTALHYAALSGMREICVAILKHASFTQPRSRDIYGRTGLEMADGFLAADVWREVNTGVKPDNRQTLAGGFGARSKKK